MEKEAIGILEYGKVLDMIAERAGSNMGKEMARNLMPSGNFADAEEWLKETGEAVRIYALSAPPLGGIRDIRESLKKVKLGASLDGGEILDILSSMYAMREIKRFFKESEDAPILKELAAGIEILGNLERRLDSAVDEHGELRDSASPELLRIRRELRSSQSKIKERVSSILHDENYRKYFQDALVTMRDDRYVIPVKQEYRHQFPGIVHDQSSSGSTLFIEPMAVVELNNDVKQLSAAELQEMARILRLLSREISKNGEVLTENSERMARVDFAFAKAKLARDMEAAEPLLNNSGKTVLRRARHPLIPKDKVVPIDISIGEDYRMLLVTGPNTGGKTVSMKTLGLFALMARSGCFLPAASGSEIAFYGSVYADIGDEQSIEQSLSTFSAHMTRLVNIINRAEKGDLLLLDEIGAGTDPEEGAALAMAILERLQDIGTSVVATTHYSQLKTFAYSRDGIENACVEFDVETLRPTYRLLIGIPGASNAFAISRRLGLGESLVLRAQQLVRADHSKFEKVINELENEKMMYEQRNADIMERQQRVMNLERKVAAMKEELDRNKGDIIRKAREKSAAMVRQTRRESEEIIESLKAQFDDLGVKARQQAMQEARSRLKEAAERANPGIMAQKSFNKRIDLSSLSPGDTVYVTKLDQKGTVLSVQGKEIEVQMGNLRTNVKASACRFVSKGETEKEHRGVYAENSQSRQSNQSGTLLQKTANARREIDIRGMMVDEGEQVLGKFIDDAVMAGMRQVLVIHGKGTGALRKGIHEYLKHHRSVLGYSLADINEGGTGATIVELK